MGGIFQSKRQDPEAKLHSPVETIATKPASQPANPPPSPKRGTTRFSVFKSALLTYGHGAKLEVIIRNISATGAKVEFFKTTLLGERVLLSEPSLPLQIWANVVWEKDGESGLQFIAPDKV